jgi:uncharacterized protein YqhQ
MPDRPGLLFRHHWLSLPYFWLKTLGFANQSQPKPAQPQTELSKAELPKVGGQAVLNGVMMRGENRWSVAVRTEDGSMKTQITPHKAWTKKKKIFGLPFIRGAVVLLESLVIGFKALNFSAEVAASDLKAKDAKETKPGDCAQLTAPSPDALPAAAELPANVNDQAQDLKTSFDQQDLNQQDLNQIDAQLSAGAYLTKPIIEPYPGQTSNSDPAKTSKTLDEQNIPPKESKALSSLHIAASILAGLCLAIVLFVAAPHVLSVLLGKAGGFDESNFVFHLLDGFLKFGIFLAYVWGIGLIPEIGQVYAYHGAEHKAIHVLEAGLSLTPAQAQPFPTWHPRCGTAFIFLVLAFSILFFAILFPLAFPFESLGRIPRALAGVGIKTLFMLPLASLAYEVTRIAGRPKANLFWRSLVWPGLMLQKLTTRQPNDSQLEVAFSSLLAVLDRPLNNCSAPSNSVPPCPSI